MASKRRKNNSSTSVIPSADNRVSDTIETEYDDIAFENDETEGDASDKDSEEDIDSVESTHDDKNKSIKHNAGKKDIITDHPIKKTTRKRSTVKIGDNATNDKRASRNRQLSSRDLKNGKTILTTVVAVAIIIILVLSIALSTVISNNNSGADDNAKNTSLTTTTGFDETMPQSAASEALKWFDDVVVSYDDAMKDGYLDSDEASTDLNNLANGDDSKIPDSIKDAFYWNTDVITDGKTIDEQTLKAAGYTAIMSAWQLRTTARQQNPDLTLNKNLVYVDRIHGTVIIPAEAWCGLPAEIVVQVVWTGKEWKIDGAATATQITTRVRAAQLQSIANSNSSDDSSSGE